jgi:hypothetical protein
MSRFHRFDHPDLPMAAFVRCGPRGRLQTLEGGGGSSAPPPDPRLVQQQIDSMSLQNQAITDMVKEQKALQPEQLAQMQATLDATNQTTKNAASDYKYATTQRALLAPLQQQMVTDANTYNTTDNANKLANQSASDVSQAFGKSQANMIQNLQDYGVNPSSGHMLAMNNSSNIAEATAKAEGMTQARNQAQQTGWDLTSRAAQSLAGTPQLAMSSNAQLGASAIAAQNGVNAGVSGIMQPLASAGGSAGNAASTAGQAYGTQLNAYTSSQNAKQSSQDATMGAVGAVAGAALVVF